MIFGLLEKKISSIFLCKCFILSQFCYHFKRWIKLRRDVISILLFLLLLQEIDFHIKWTTKIKDTCVNFQKRLLVKRNEIKIKMICQIIALNDYFLPNLLA